MIKAKKFVLRIDKQGYSTNFYSNGIVAFRIKCDLETFGYKIIELKTGITVVVRESCNNRSHMLISAKRDVMRLFEIHGDADNIFTKRLKGIKRTIT